MENRLPAEVLAFLRRVAAISGEEGFPLFLVGGVVRDLVLDETNLDLDLVVEGDAMLLAQRLGEKLGGMAVAHRQFGTAKFLTGKQEVDIATARTETYARPGALPIVRPGSIDEDLGRRDFTINAMAVALSPSSFGDLHDPFRGKADLRAGLVRVLHDRSFIDDATRILRAIRYEQRFGFRLEAHTEQLLHSCLSMLKTVSGDRVRHEIERALNERQPELVLARMSGLGILQEIDLSLTWDDWLQEKFVAARDCGRASPRVFLALWLQRVPGPDLDRVTRYLGLPSSTSRVVRDAQAIQSSTPALAQGGLLPSHFVKLLGGHVEEALWTCYLATDSAIIKERLLLYVERLRLVKPLLDGRRLMELGVKPGPHVGELLRLLRDARLDGTVKTEEDEVVLVRKSIVEG